MRAFTKQKRQLSYSATVLRLWMMWTMVFAAVALSPAHAHDVDDQLVRKRYSDLGHDDPKFAQCWRDYWHFRREFVIETVKYGECVGQLRLLVNHTGFNPALLGIIRQDILDYWNVIPAVPVLEQSARLGRYGRDDVNGATRYDYCKANIDAAKFSLNETQAWHGHCSYWVTALSGLLR
jgi:hypothetical protein